MVPSIRGRKRNGGVARPSVLFWPKSPERKLKRIFEFVTRILSTKVEFLCHTVPLNFPMRDVLLPNKKSAAKMLTMTLWGFLSVDVQQRSYLGALKCTVVKLKT